MMKNRRGMAAEASEAEVDEKRGWRAKPDALLLPVDA